MIPFQQSRVKMQLDTLNLTQQTMLHDFHDDIEEIASSTLAGNLLETVTLATGMGFAAVARVTDTRWVTCRAVDKISFGLRPGDELDVETTLCHEVRQSSREIIIADVKNDPAYCNHHTPRQYAIQSYISVPIFRKDGSFFGTLCAIDPEPKNLEDGQIIPMFRLFAKMIGDCLDADAKLAESQKFVQQERDLAEIQQQFIAILAHDLRNPITVLNSGLRMLGRSKLETSAGQIVTLMRASLDRMANLVENLLDQARQRQQGGILVDRDADAPLVPVILQIVAEIKAVSSDHVIDCDIDLPDNVNCDRDRIAQMLSNLLGNAITHGADGRSIKVVAGLVDDQFVMSVANQGKMIPADQLPSLFMPFNQGECHRSRNGLGLGLYISSEIAKSHGGTLQATSNDDRTEFTFRMPLL